MTRDIKLSIWRLVQILKQSLIKDVLDTDGKVSLPISHRLANFLVINCSTSHTITGHVLKMELAKRFEESQAAQKLYHDHGVCSVLSWKWRLSTTEISEHRACGLHITMCEKM